jgi:hypothetical protein
MASEPIRLRADRADSKDTMTTRHKQFEPEEDADALPPLTHVALRWLKRAAVMGLVISLVVHVIALVASTMIIMPAGRGEGSGGVGGAVEMALVSGESLGSDAASELPSFATPGEGLSADLGSADAPLSVGGETGASGQVGVGDGLVDISVGAGDIGGTGDLGGGGVGGGGGIGSGGTSFFGVEARGERFVYIVDTSGSMGVAGKIQALKKELLQSISKMADSAQFVVIPFSDSAVPIGGKGEWTRATPTGRKVISREIEVLRADGGTEPFGGFEIAFVLRPRPHAIFFMTDGEFADQTAEQIISLNKDWKVPIHCLCFVSNGAEATMKRIAQESGGTYTFVPGPSP